MEKKSSKSRSAKKSSKAGKAVVPHKTADIKTETLLALITTKTNKEAYELLGIGERTLYDRIEKYNLREELAKVPQAALQRLQASSVQAANAMSEELDNRGKKLEAAKEILDRVGLKGAGATLAVQINNYGKLTDEQLNKLIEAKARKIGIAVPPGGKREEEEAGSAEIFETTQETEGSN